MSISKKGRRKIIINNEVYYWMIRRDPTYGHLMGFSNHIAITHESEAGKNLIVELPYARPDSLLSDAIIVRPQMVKEYILLALEKGWNHQEKGPYFFLCIDKDKVSETDVVPYVLRKDPGVEIGFRFREE